MTIAEQYNKALHEGDRKTAARINKELLDTPIKEASFTLFVRMGECNRSAIGVLKEVISLEFSEYGEIDYSVKSIKDGVFVAKIPLNGKRLVKEFRTNELDDMLHLPFCGVRNVTSTLEDGSRLWWRECRIPTNKEWKQYTEIFKQSYRPWVGKSLSNFDKLLSELNLAIK